MYWATAPLEPGIEAISKEVFDLAGWFGRSRIFSINPHLGFRVMEKGRVLGFNPRLDLLLRPAILALEAFCDVNHIYGEISPWIYSRTLRRRPIVLTIASEKGEPQGEFLSRCRVIAAQTNQMRERLAAYASADTRLELIYPGVDLSTFRPGPGAMSAGRPRVLLATFPRTAGELEGRGINFLIEAAAALPDVEFTFLTRPWRAGETAIAQVRERIASLGLRNVHLLSGVQSDMSIIYAGADFTVIPYATPDGGKECPRSLVESMACGIPVLISAVAPFSRFVGTNGCGTVFTLEDGSFAAALEDAIAHYRLLSERAAACARDWFDQEATRRRYSEIYDAIA